MFVTRNRALVQPRFTATIGQQTPEIFVSAERQLQIVRQKNIACGWRFSETDFAALGNPPSWPSQRLCAVVLEIRFSTISATFETAWNLIKLSQRGQVWRWDKIKSDERNLRLLPGAQIHQRGLRWRIVDLAANWDEGSGVRPMDARNCRTSPDCALLWAAWYFPEWIHSMDGVNIPNIWIAGYQMTIEGYEPWFHLPHLSKDTSQLVRFHAGSSDYRRPKWAIPEFCE